jgi:hypothetical protein
MVPQLGAIIVGPCPQCSEMVMVFCGRTLALDRTLLTNATTEEKRQHVLTALTGFLSERVDELVDQINETETIMSHEGLGRQAPVSPLDDLVDEDVEEEAMALLDYDAETGEVISENELCQFRQIDLKLLDNREYFDSIFG